MVNLKQLRSCSVRVCDSIKVGLVIARGSSIGSSPRSEFSQGLVGSISYALVKDTPSN